MPNIQISVFIVANIEELDSVTLFSVNCLKFSEDRPRPKGVFRKNRREEISTTNNDHQTNHRGRPDLYNRNKRSRFKNKKKYSDIISIWPKIVEYIGLSEYESKVYLSLINLGTAGARKLSLNCDVPRTKLYGTLKKLIDYGLVVEIPGTPKHFVPSHPGESFKTILNVTKEKATDFDSIIKHLETIHEKHKEDTGPKKKLVWFLDENLDIKGKCNEVIRQSEESLTIVTTEDGLEMLFKAAHRILDDMLENGVEIKLYSPLDPRVNPLARELSYIYQVKMVEVNTPILFINSDDKRFILAKLASRGSEKPIESAIFADDKEVLGLVCLLLLKGHKEMLLKALNLQEATIVPPVKRLQTQRS